MDFNPILLGPRPDDDFFGGLDLTELANATSKSISTFVGVADRESIIFSQHLFISLKLVKWCIPMSEFY